MEPWVIVVIALVVLAILVAFAAGWLRRVRLRSGDQEVSAEAPSGGKLKSIDSKFRRSKVKGRGAHIEFRKSEADDSGFDIK